MSKDLENLYYSSQLIKSVGDSILEDGRSLSESLTIEGISYWDVFAVELARIYLPYSLTASDDQYIVQLIKPTFIKTKYFFRDF